MKGARFLRKVLICSVLFGCVNYVIWHFGEPMPVPGPEPEAPAAIPDVVTHAAIVIQMPFYWLADLLLPRSLNENIPLLVVSILSGAGYASIWELELFLWRQIRQRLRPDKCLAANKQ